MGIFKNQPLKKAAAKVKAAAPLKKVSTGLKAVANKGVTGIKTVAKKTGGGVSKLGGKLIGVAKKTGDNAQYAPLLPFKTMMVHLLDNRGIKHTDKIDDIAKKFHTNIVSKNFDDTLEQMASDENFAFEQGQDMYSLTDNAADGIGATAVGAGQIAAGDYAGASGSLIKAIIAWIKAAKEKKAKGQKLSAEEEKGLKDAEEAALKLDDAGQLPAESGSITDTIGSITSQIWEWLSSPAGKIFLGVVAAILIFLGIRKYKKGKGK